MSIVEELMREDVRRMELYQVQPVSGVKLDANESPFPMSKDFRTTIAQWILEEEDLRIYPDTDCTLLREAIADRWGLESGQVLCAVGSDQIIDYLNKAFLDTGDSIVVPAPSFSMYALSARINHAEAHAFALAEDFSYPVEDIVSLCRQLRPKILYLCTPNNPTGNRIPEEDLRRLIQEAGCIVACDEAYGEFSGEDHSTWLAEYPNLVILKTFSKAYALAGIRTGYALAQPELIQALDRVRAPYNLSTLSQLIARKALAQPEYEEEIRMIRRERDRIYGKLAPLNGRNGFWIYPSQANFFLMKFSGTDAAARLLGKGLLVRAYGGDMARFVRSSVGSREENDALIDAIVQIVKEDGK